MRVGEKIGRLSRATLRLMCRRLAAREGRSLLELRALKAIDREHVRTQVALCERLLVDAAAASRLVDRLEKAGLLKRLPGEDRRCVRLELTARGQRELLPLDDALAWFDRRVRDVLTAAELKELERLLVKAADGLIAAEQLEARESGHARA